MLCARYYLACCLSAGYAARKAFKMALSEKGVCERVYC